MSQKIKTSVEIDGSLKASQIANATTDTDKFLVSDSGTVKYRTGAEVLSDLGITVNTASKLQHQVKAGVAINKGQAVYVTSADGTNMIVGLASNASEATSSKTMGLLDGTVAINGFANVVTEGLLSGLSITGAVSEGDPVWLGTGGNLIYGLANKPSAPNHLVFIGIVTRVNANNGEIFVKVQNGFELDEIHDVDLKTTTKINGHLLGYNGSLWVNKTIAEWLGYTPQAQLNGTGFVKASGTTITYDNTSYYPASNPNGYISTYAETDTLASVTGRGNTTTSSIFANGVRIGRDFSLANRATVRLDSNGDYPADVLFGRDVDYNDTGWAGVFWSLSSRSSSENNVFRLYRGNANTGGSELVVLEANASGSVTAPVDLRAPIFYDLNNTGYYVDPASQSNLYTVYANSYNLYNGNTIWNSGNDGSGSGLDADLLDGQQATSFAKQAYVNVGYDFNTLAAENSDSGIVYRLESSVANPPNGSIYNWSLWQQGTSTRGSQIAVGAYGGNEIYFRGANADTGSYRGWQRVLHDGNYSSYAVPTSRTITINGTSYDLSANRSWTVTAVETDTLQTVTSRGNTSSNPIILRTSYPYMQFEDTVTGTTKFAWQQLGVTLAGSGAGGGGYFTTYSQDKPFGWTVGGNQGVMTIDTSGNVQALSSSRAPIFYDSNNTGYYVDPASGSNMSAVYVDNWFRTYGKVGVYSQSYGVHIYPYGGEGWAITGSGGNVALQFRSNHESTLRGYAYADTSNNIGFLNNSGNWSFRVDSSGNATATGDVTAYSDIRVKENIITLDNALDKVLSLRGVYYNRVDSEDKQRKVGVIAQETLEVLPEVVGKDTDGMYNVAYGNITAVLIEAIKEQQTQIQELKQLVNTLTNK